MRAGDLRYVLTVQYRTGAVSTDSYGGEHPVWGTFATVRGAKRPLHGRDLMTAQAMQSVASAKFVIRYLPGMTSTMRIVEGGTTYEIVGEPIDIDGRGRWHEVLCKAVSGA